MAELKYKVVLSGRRSISIILSPDKGITVRAPYRTSLRTIDNFVTEKSAWIMKHQDKYQNLIRLNQERSYFDGDLHLFMGKEKILKITESARSYVGLVNDHIEVGLSEKDNLEKIRILLEVWYVRKATEIFSQKLQDLLKRYSDYNFKPAGFVVRPLRSRWGSCSSRGSITINSGLVKLDDIFSDYVITHELCHLKHHNHSKDYYRLLSEIVPDYKLIRKELRKYITR